MYIICEVCEPKQNESCFQQFFLCKRNELRGFLNFNGEFCIVKHVFQETIEKD